MNINLKKESVLFRAMLKHRSEIENILEYNIMNYELPINTASTVVHYFYKFLTPK